MEAIRGVYTVLATPFLANGDLDLDSMERQVHYLTEAGVDGLVCFGLAGEGYKLTDAERATVLQTVVRAASGRVKVVAGADHSGTDGVVSRCREAETLGAHAVMVYPPSFVRPDEYGVAAFYSQVAKSVTIPVIVQDAPGWTGVPLPLRLIRSLAEDAGITYVKVEAPATAPKISDLAATGIKPISGYGALFLPEDLAAGAVALMPGPAFTPSFLRIWRSHVAGDVVGTLSEHARILPVLSFQMATLDLFVAVNKWLLVEMGVLDGIYSRQPRTLLTSSQERWLRMLVSGLTESDWRRER